MLAGVTRMTGKWVPILIGIYAHDGKVSLVVIVFEVK
jgi:hypothetical protein